MGSSGREVPYETQFMLLEGPGENYTVLLPIIDGAFRACLQGNAQNELQLCVESGESSTLLICWEIIYCVFFLKNPNFFGLFLIVQETPLWLQITW